MNPLNNQVFSPIEGLTFDDVVLVPGFSNVLPSDVDVSGQLVGDISLAVPVMSAAMDKVTESAMAIALARIGGIGILHRNMTIAEQADNVSRVKRSQAGMITDPVTLPVTSTLADAEALMNRYRFSGVPITDANGLLLGILTNRDIRFCGEADFSKPVRDFMTHSPLVTASVGTTLDEARSLLQKHRIEKLPLVDDKGFLQGLITVKDIMKEKEHPFATRDSGGRLRVGAAVGVGIDLEDRVSALVDKGIDMVVVDTAHGHTQGVLDAVRRIKSVWPSLPVIAGNVVTEEGVDALADAGVDAVKVGVGAGSICTTRVVAGAGMPQLSAIWYSAQRAATRGLTVIADGGVTYSGDVVKALAAGAHIVMLGSLLAGTDESPGEHELFEGRRYKAYRGMGSLGAMQGLGADRYGSGQASGNVQPKLVPEGIEGRVAYSGSLSDVVYQLVGGLRSGMGYVGAENIQQLQAKARFMKVTAAGREESHPHDVTITHEAPNYHS
ncbi:MAG: IMP dehydrogenase [Ilumatobacteraceae bacterium]|jgi:IMP dehydrogenase|nr:IMP dehydrogenase [Ilumatobacteraceae bacterium]